MASGKVHNFVTMVLIAPAGYLALQASGGDALAMVATGAGCAMGLLVDPDLDIDTGTRNKKRARKIFGHYGAIPWLVFWHGYSLAVPHRSPISHLPLLGTIIRLLYWFGGGTIIGFLIWPAGTLWAWQQLILPIGGYLAWAFLGMATSDFFHWVFDGFPLKGKEKKK